MWQYLQRHEQFVISALAEQRAANGWEQLKAFHARQIQYMQHERLIHLLVMLFVATFFLLNVGFVTLHPSGAGYALAAVLLGLVSFYILHYFRLENGVQRWYELANRIDQKLGLPTSGKSERT